MDPFSAVAFAGTILTFVDFSWNLIKGSCEVYQSVTGETVENAHINDVISDLRNVSEDLDGTPTGNSKHEKALRRLAAECSELSTDLTNLLKKLKRSEKKNMVWSSLRAKWASMRKSGDLASMLERLHDYRSEIMLRLNLMLSDQQSSIEVKLRQIRKEATELNAVTAAQLDTLRSDILAAVTAIREREDEYVSDSETLGPFEAGEVPTASASDAEAREHSLQGVNSLLMELISQAKGTNIQHNILRQLDFKSRFAREETIQDAETGTFEWMLWDGVDDDSSDSKEGDFGSTDRIPGTDFGTDFGFDFDLNPALVEYGADDLLTSPSSPSYHSSSDDDSCSVDLKDHHSGGASQQPVITESPAAETGGEFLAQPEDPVEADLAASVETLWSLEIAPQETPPPVPEIASDPGEGPRRRHLSAFMSWLRYGSHIFHISGKAGSGKSTLMKFAYNDERTKRALQHWASPKKLVTAHFYFWRSAQDELQMSLDGLYRSILFEVLCQCPDLIPVVFSQQWDAMAHQSDVQSGHHMAASAVRRAFEILVSKACNLTHRFCLFIDGLDEYHGDSVAHWELARHLQAWTRQTDIKMCISARPHTEFLVTFSGPPNTTIHLHELTRRDIYNFSVRMFDKDPNATELSTEACANLAHKIVDKAEGVFLWAWLTVRLLLDSLGRRDKPEILFQRLEGVPEGLDDLYERLLGTVLGADRRRSDLALLLAVSNPFPEPLNAIAYTWLDELESNAGGFFMTASLRSFSAADIKDAHDYARRQLHSLTKGLLEVYPSNHPANRFFALRVQFFHRTAMDYLSDPARLETLRTRHHALLDLSHAFAWLRLAEYMCGIDGHSINGLRSWGTLRIPYDFLVETFHCIEGELPVPVVEGFRVAVTHRLLTSPSPRSTTSNRGPRYSVPVFFATHGNADGASFHDCHAHGSWPHFAAAYAQTQYVLDLVGRQPELALVDEGGELSLLLSAMTGGDARLVRELVHCGGSLHDCVAMRDRTHSRSRAPVWLLAVANCVWQLIQALASGSMKRRKTRSTVHALREWIVFGADANLVLTVQQLSFVVASPLPFEGGDGSGRHFREGSDTDEITALIEGNGGNDDAAGTSGINIPIERDFGGPEFDVEAGDTDDTDSERSSSLRRDERPRFLEEKAVARTYSCTIGRFLTLCESPVSNFDDRRRDELPRETWPKDNQPDDIVHSWLFVPGKRHPGVLEQSRDMHASLSWKGKALGLPFTYRVY